MNKLTAFEHAMLQRRLKIDRAQEMLTQMQTQLTRQREELELECQHLHRTESGTCKICGLNQ